MSSTEAQRFLKEFISAVLWTQEIQIKDVQSWSSGATIPQVSPISWIQHSWLRHWRASLGSAEAYLSPVHSKQVCWSRNLQDSGSWSQLSSSNNTECRVWQREETTPIWGVRCQTGSWYRTEEKWAGGARRQKHQLNTRRHKIMKLQRITITNKVTKVTKKKRWKKSRSWHAAVSEPWKSLVMLGGSLDLKITAQLLSFDINWWSWLVLSVSKISLKQHTGFSSLLEKDFLTTWNLNYPN